MFNFRITAYLIALLGLHIGTAQALEISDYALKNKMEVINVEGLNDDEADAKSLSDLAQRKIDARSPFFIQFNSPGGDLEAGVIMSNTIIEMAARYQRIFGKPLNVVVDVTCQSACTIIMANLTKNRFNLDRREILKIMVAKDADFKFHGPSAKGSSAYVKELRDSQVFAAYLNSGTNPAWLMERKLWFKSSKMHSVSGAKLAKESSGIIPADSVRDDIDAIVAEILN